MTQSKATRANEIYRQLRTDILNGQLKPGSRLPFLVIGQRYDVSAGVLREVLPRLVEQGLATAESQLGYRVVSVSVEDLCHLTEARVAVETLALRQSVNHGSLEWETAVVAAHHQLARTPENLPSGDLNPDWLNAHARFHRVLLEGCQNVRLRAIADGLRDVAEVYRCWSFGTDGARERDVAAEHRLLANATVTRKADEAVAALTEHIQITTDLLIASQATLAAPA